MPNIKSAGKRAKQALVRNARNVSEKSMIATLRRKFAATLEKADKAECAKAFGALSSVVDRAVKKGILKQGTASRIKSRANAKLAALA